MQFTPKIQNKIIGLFSEKEDSKQAKAYAVMANETADIAGKEQLSIGLRFYDENQEKIRLKFRVF